MSSAQLIDLLWGAAGPEDEVFALLDGARDPTIHNRVRRSGLDHRCLFQGKLTSDFARASPYLVNLSRRAGFTRQLLAMGWGRSWGVFVRSPVLLQELQRHLRRFLQVQDEAGETLFFRFYDPRVLRAYLPTCTGPELTTFFGPVTAFALEGAAGELRTFTLGKGERLEVESRQLSALQ